MTARVRLAALIWMVSQTAVMAQTGSGGAPVPSTAPSFGYTTASDVGPAGQWLGLIEQSQRIGKRDGDYDGLRFKFAAAYGLSDHLSIGGATASQYLHIDDVEGLGARSGPVFEGFALNAKYLIQNRETSGIGLAFEFTPQWTPANPVTGDYGEHSLISEFKGVADFSLIEDVLAAAINVKYQPTFTHLEDGWLETSGAEVSGAIAVSIPNGSVGVEVRRLSLHEGLALGHETGRAVYVGPTFAVGLSPTASLSGSWGFQVEGRSQLTPDKKLDLVSFDKNQSILRLNFGF